MTRARLLPLLALASTSLAACSLVRSLDGYSTTFGLDAGDGGDGAADACATCGATEILARGQARPNGVAVTPAYVFWANEGAGTVVRCPVAGCGAGPGVVAGNQAGPTAVTTDDVEVFWANGGGTTVGHCAQTDCTIPIEVGSGDAGVPIGVAAMTYVYWTTKNGNLMAFAGSPFAQPQVLVSDEAELGGLAMRRTGSVSGPVWAFRGGVMTCAETLCRGDGGPTLFASDPGPVTLVATGAHDVVWASDVAIRSCPIEGCAGPPRTIADGQDHPRGLALDESRVYWTNGDDTVRACPLAGCPPEGPSILAAHQDDPQGIAATTTHVYWASRGLGIVARQPTR